MSQLTDLEIIKILLEEMEGHHAHLRVSRGYGTGHPHFGKRKEKTLLGSSEFEEEPDQPEVTSPQQVKISRAFKHDS